MECELCGKIEDLYTSVVEGVELNVCVNCSSLGKVVEKVQEKIIPTSKINTIKKEVIESIVDNYSSKIRSSRESMNLNQKEFANKINEKESVVHKLETGSMKLTLDLARKLEKHLNLKLVEKFQEESYSNKDISTEDLTIGDLIKIKKK
tara:strand:- start:491 stop:937 length:447 start_codon:yes stop_codon:yes gene_type:complete